MAFSVHGIAVSRGVAIGRAVLVTSSRLDVAHYFIEPAQVEEEIARVRHARNVVVDELTRLQQELLRDEAAGLKTPPELAALLEVHLMLLTDKELEEGVKHWIVERHYNAEWALNTQLEQLVRQFDEMQDEYLRERKSDLEQVVERVLRVMRGALTPAQLMRAPANQGASRKTQQELLPSDESHDVPLVLVAHDLSPADMMQFKKSVFAGFITDVGGKTSHTAIVARSMDIPALVGARTASQLVQQDDWVIIDGDAGVMVVDPSPIILAEYQFKQRQAELERMRLHRIKHTPCVTLDGQVIQLQANIEMPEDTVAAVHVGAVGVGLFRSEFLFMGRHGNLPDEQEQFQAYKQAVEGMHGMPVVIRTIDIGADKPLDHGNKDNAYLNPALGLRAIRWSLSEPEMFLTQLRAILRAAAYGKTSMLIPMLSHVREITQTLHLIDKARTQLDAKGIAYGPVEVGAMIEIPAAALMLPVFLKYFDFLSIGTNDLIQYTLAIDRADEAVAHLYDPLHPAVLQLIAGTIEQGERAGKSVSVCGEMAGDPSLTRLLLGLGLKCFSMHPSQLLSVKQEVLRADAQKLRPWAQKVLTSESPAATMQA
jgi:phosphoenolpyruvate-protein phosphotransferase (PTS system enzyme I)